MLPGIEVAFGDHGVLLVRGPSVMLGYWRNPEATATVLDAAGWLDTGDQAKLENGLLYITGRIKEIIVMANGEKVPPVDMELAIQLDPLLEQALVVGEGKPYLGALVALDMDEWHQVAEAEGCPPIPRRGARTRGEARSRAHRAAGHAFPGYAQVRRVAARDKWTVDNGLLTPTLKPRRAKILELHRDRVAEIYRGRGVRIRRLPRTGSCHEPAQEYRHDMKRRSFMASLFAAVAARFEIPVPGRRPLRRWGSPCRRYFRLEGRRPNSTPDGRRQWRITRYGIVCIRLRARCRYQYHHGESVWSQLAEGQALDLTREPGNLMTPGPSGSIARLKLARASSP